MHMLSKVPYNSLQFCLIFYQVDVVGLSSFEEKEELFKEQVGVILVDISRPY